MDRGSFPVSLQTKKRGGSSVTIKCSKQVWLRPRNHYPGHVSCSSVHGLDNKSSHPDRNTCTHFLLRVFTLCNYRLSCSQPIRGLRRSVRSVIVRLRLTHCAGVLSRIAVSAFCSNLLQESKCVRKQPALIHLFTFIHLQECGPYDLHTHTHTYTQVVDTVTHSLVSVRVTKPLLQSIKCFL